MVEQLESTSDAPGFASPFAPYFQDTLSLDFVIRYKIAVLVGWEFFLSEECFLFFVFQLMKQSSNLSASVCVRNEKKSARNT